MHDQAKQKLSKQLPAILIVVLLILFFSGFDPFRTNKTYNCADNCLPGRTAGFPQTIGNCADCMPLKGSGIPYANWVGEYLNVFVFKKLQILAKINKNWRVTEAYPSTVRHLSFCHSVGTCADIALYRERVSKQNLLILCRDALAAGLSVINEYTTHSISEAGAYCPSSQIFETTTGSNLHVY